MMAECIEACRATTPITAAENRRAMSATTASRSAFDRSVRMQAIRMEIVANQVSKAELDAGAVVCRLKLDQATPPSPPLCARTRLNIAAGSQIQKLARVEAAFSPIGRRAVGRYDDRVLAIRTTDRCGARANQSAVCEDIAIERRARQTPRSKMDLPPTSLLFGSVPFRADCCGALKIRLSFAI